MRQWRGAKLRGPRWWHRFRAWLGGYFWLPCPVCGQRFGGHERGGGEVLLDAVSARLTCPQCPGQWLEQAGAMRELRVDLGDDGEPQVRAVYASSEWRHKRMKKGSRA